MNRVVAFLGTVLLVTALALPSFGPLIDHHFAERLPSHRHLSAATTHAHAFNLSHSENGDSTDSPTALYNHDSGLAIVVSMTIDASSLGYALRRELSSSLNLPVIDRNSSKTLCPSPPNRPPRLNL
jgi:hypothetical protein